MRSPFSDPFERMNLTICAGALATSLALAPASFTVSLGIGALLEAVSFRALRRATQQLFSSQIGGSKAWSALFSLRFLFLGAAMFVALKDGAHPIGLVLGLSTMVPAVVIVAIRTPVPQAPERDDPVPAPDDPSWDEWNPWLAHGRDPEEREDEL